GEGDAGGAARGRRRVHRPAPAGLRHDDRGARGEPLRRPAPAHRHRPRARHQSAHPDPRRGDLGARLRQRADHPGEYEGNRARPDRHHHRPPAGGGSSVQPDRRHAAGRDRRGRFARGAPEAGGRALRPSVGLTVRPGEDAGMNERTAPPTEPPPPSPAPRPAPAVSGRDREFLPAALEILESPPPPLPNTLIGTICVFALVALSWSFFGRLDVHAVAPGKVETAGYSKVIEPLDPGKVAAIHVEAGQSVKAGDILFELDPAEANADAAAARDALDASRAEIARRRFAIEAVRNAEGEEAQPDSGR